MEPKSKAGRWTKLFGGAIGFCEEIKRAKMIDVEWRKRMGPLGAPKTGHTDIDFTGLPGWLQPLWASDGDWLYIRRPEGVWKTRIPMDLWSNAPVFFIQKMSGNSTSFGRMMLGSKFCKTDGWANWFGDPSTPEEEDLKSSAVGLNVEVDFIGPPLIQYDGDENRLIVVSGDEFNFPPKFEIKGDWLIATDSHNGTKCGYSLRNLDVVRTALIEKCLWIRFRGTFAQEFETKVCF